MGLFGRGKKDGGEQKEAGSKLEGKAGTPQDPAATPASSPDVKGGAAVSAAMPTETSVFEFGSASTSEERITLAGYCPVSDDLEPCRWEILPSGGTEAPKFRIIF